LGKGALGTRGFFGIALRHVLVDRGFQYALDEARDRATQFGILDDREVVILRCMLKSWIPHYNTGRPYMALDPGAPDPPLTNLEHPRPNSRHRRGESYAVRVNPILSGLYHEYFLASAYT
jgi:hypothetical protein